MACQLPVQPESSQSSDPEGEWLFPSQWQRPLARHAAWFTVHAVREDGKLLCGRARSQLHVDASGPVDDWPACQICQSRVRAYGRPLQAAEESEAPVCETDDAKAESDESDEHTMEHEVDIDSEAEDTGAGGEDSNTPR